MQGRTMKMPIKCVKQVWQTSSYTHLHTKVLRQQCMVQKIVSFDSHLRDGARKQVTRHTETDRDGKESWKSSPASSSTSWGGTPNVMVRMSTISWVSTQGKLKWRPSFFWHDDQVDQECLSMISSQRSALPGPLEPPWSSLPRRKMTALSYSCTTCKWMTKSL